MYFKDLFPRHAHKPLIISKVFPNKHKISYYHCQDWPRAKPSKKKHPRSLEKKSKTNSSGRNQAEQVL